MGYRKLALGALILSLYSSTLFSSDDFASFKNEQKQGFTKYQNDINSEFKAFKKAYEESFKEYKNEILKKWPTLETSSKHKWVQYDKNYNSKKIIDYKNKQIKIQVIAKDDKEAKEQLKKLSKKILAEDKRTAIKNDNLQNKINKKLNKNNKPIIKNNKKLISDVLSKKEQKNIIKKVQEIKAKKQKFKGKFIYTVVVKLPSNSVIRKAKTFKNDVSLNASKRKVPEELVYAIMHSESSFNPMARSHIPAFGLMQIVPRTAGVDTYKFLYGKKKVLSSTYLYDSSNNIKIGTAYLHILYYRYLRKIKDPQARMYCAIAAYNTGAGNVAKAFIGSYNISRASVKINQMSADEVYNHLLKKLPYVETQRYLKKVTGRMNSYHKLIGKVI